MSRVKDKHAIENKSKLINLKPSDFESLQSICTHISNILDIEYAHKSLQLSTKEFEKSYNDLKNFHKVFLHEIRTPISTFSTSPLRIQKLLKNYDENKFSVEKKLDDIKVMGERLSFIANTYYFHELVKSRKPKKLSVMKNIVFPVLNISRDYIRNQYEIYIHLDLIHLEGAYVYGDKMLLNIVFNTLISNAGKYGQISGKPITVKGERDANGNYFYIVVSNYGLFIHENEREKIFFNGYRGQEVEKQKLGGTGIGLYLAKEIMKNQQNGDLLLTSYEKPVTFKIKIPIRKWIKGVTHG